MPRIKEPHLLAPRYNCYQCAARCDDHKDTDHEFQIMGLVVLSTVEENITYDARKQRFRVIIKHRHVCYTKTMEEAMRRRDFEKARLACIASS